MAEIVNLRRVRKSRQRAAKENEATQNRLRFGTAKGLRAITKARSEKAGRELDAKRLEPGDPADE